MRDHRINISRFYVPVHHVKKDWCGTSLVSTLCGSWISAVHFPSNKFRWSLYFKHWLSFTMQTVGKTTKLGIHLTMFCERFFSRYVWTGYYTVASVNSCLWNQSTPLLCRSSLCSFSFTKLADSANVPNVDLNEPTCTQKKSCPKNHFSPFELSQTEIIQEKNLSERQMTVAHLNIHSAPNSEQFSELQRPSKTKCGPLHLNLPGTSTEKQCTAIASFLSLFSALRQVSVSLSPSGLIHLQDSSIQNTSLHLTLQCSSQKNPQQDAKVAVNNFANLQEG